MDLLAFVHRELERKGFWHSGVKMKQERLSVWLTHLIGGSTVIDPPSFHGWLVVASWTYSVKGEDGPTGDRVVPWNGEHRTNSASMASSRLTVIAALDGASQCTKKTSVDWRQGIYVNWRPGTVLSREKHSTADLYLCVRKTKDCYVKERQTRLWPCED